jgi:nicotinamide-nucleotide amidase
MFPAGSRVIRNPHGTAPGIDFEAPRDGLPPCRVFVLPGVPAEMVEMWNDSVAEAIRGLAGRGRIIRRRRVNCFGAGESQIESMLPDLIRRGRYPTVGINASKATIILRIAAEGDSQPECDAAIESTVATIRQCLGTLVFGEEDDELQHVVVRMLRERGQTLAAAEWGTAGLVTDLLGGVEGAGGTFLGGVVAINEAACRKLLGIGDEVAGPARDAEEYVSAMATACRERFGADFGLAVGPLPAVVKKWGLAPSRNVQSSQNRCQARCLSPFFHTPAAAPAGEPPPLHFALASAAGVRRLHISSGIHPALVRIYCAKHALNLVRLAMR